MSVEVIAQFAARAPIGLLPVLAFLAALLYLDSFKLVSLRAVLLAILIGGIAAAASYPLNGALLDWLPIEFVNYSRYVSPWIEETLKAMILVYLILMLLLPFAPREPGSVPIRAIPARSRQFAGFVRSKLSAATS